VSSSKGTRKTILGFATNIREDLNTNRISVGMSYADCDSANYSKFALSLEDLVGSLRLAESPFQMLVGRDCLESAPAMTRRKGGASEPIRKDGVSHV